MQSETIAPGLRRITAPNPSPMTYTGTQTYLLGDGEVVVIDPGPALPEHQAAILATLAPGERITKILVTHSHLDHSPLAVPLSETTGAPVLAAGPSDWGRRPIMQALAASGLIGGGEGVDDDFAPHKSLSETDTIDGPWGKIEVVSTPGHMANHLSFAWDGALFSGDLVMQWSTSLVSPPDGDMTAFMESLEHLLTRAQDQVYYPGHGDPIAAPHDRCRELIMHRKGREAQILEALIAIGPADARALAQHIYTDVAPALLPAAARNVLAHLIDLSDRAVIAFEGVITAATTFSRD